MEIKIVRNVLQRNDQSAAVVRQYCTHHHLFLINVLGSPGSGKTSFIRSMLPFFASPAVIEGDIASTIDAERIAADGFPVVQINTGGSCHLIADSVMEGLRDLNPNPGSVIFVENIGNLVCPASFDLGEQMRIVVSSVAEGDDKPYKYPLMFQQAHLIVLSKSDVLDIIGFNTEYYMKGIRCVQPTAPVCPVSFKSGQGVTELSVTLSRKIGELRPCAG